LADVQNDPRTSSGLHLTIPAVANRPFSATHGVLATADLVAFEGSSLCELALTRTAIGGPAIDSLTDLEAARRQHPAGRDGASHVGINDADRVDLLDDGPPDEPLDAYIERRLRDATFVVLPNRSTGYRCAKRALDIVGAIGLIVVTLPIMLLLAIIIRVDSPGAPIFRQTRVTRGGREFRFYKFRTMYVDAKDRFPELYAYKLADRDFEGAYYKLADDPRNTRFGRWLRRTTLDELPNLWNVLKGDLSLVGPRPDLPALVRHYQPEELACLFTKAGLTGLAQVAGRSLLTVRERLTLDTRYVANQTFLLDIRILVRTVIVVLTGKGAF